MNPFRFLQICNLVAVLLCIAGVNAHDGGILATLTQTIHHLFERPVINIGVQPLSHGHGIKLGVDAVIKTRKHPKKTTHHHHHHYDEEEEVIEEHVVDHHRTGEAKQSSRARPRISFEIGRPRGGSGGGGGGGGLKVVSAPKISKRKKYVPKDYEDDDAVADGGKKEYRKKSGDVKAAGTSKSKVYKQGDPYIRSSSSYAYNSKSVQKDDNDIAGTEDEPSAAGSGPIADYERRSFHSAGGSTGTNDDED